MTIQLMPERDDDSLVRPKRSIGIMFCLIAVFVTTLAWAGVSLSDVLAAVRF